MDTIVKYRFDREMVTFVKTLEIKTAMFGYDKSAVYDKIKDLLVTARDVCGDLVREAYQEVDALKAELRGADTAPVLLQVHHAEEAGQPNGEAPETEMSPGPELAEGQIEFDSGEEMAEVVAPEPEGETAEEELIRLRRVNRELLERLETFSEREELLKRAHDIVAEARLERAAIIHNAQSEAEEELFLFRAKQREEESLSRKELADLSKKKEAIEATCAAYQAYAKEGQDLFEQLQAYVFQFNQIEGRLKEDAPADLPETIGDKLDPPVLSADGSLSCTEESMPLCEIVDEDPEGIFRGQDLTDDPAAYENEPEKPDLAAGCSEQDSSGL